MNEEEKEAIEIVQGLKVYYDDECLLDEEELNFRQFKFYS